VLHPSLGIAWFRKVDRERKLDPTDPLCAARAEVIFEHVFDSYQQVGSNEESSQPTAAVKRRQPSKLGSFLDDIRMVDVAEVAVPEVAVSELKRFWDAFKNYSGDANTPLIWWKVRELNFFIRQPLTISVSL
jgi:hypothetical protein